MKRVEVTIERFTTDSDGWYLRINGRCVACLLPSDLRTIVNAVPATESSRQFTEQVVKAHYAKENQ